MSCSGDDWLKIVGRITIFGMGMKSQNEQELIMIGKQLGQWKTGYKVILLGQGKTTFTKGSCSRFDIRQMIKSPTYTIVREYEGRLPLYHLDVYRIVTIQIRLIWMTFCLRRYRHWVGRVTRDQPSWYLKVELPKRDVRYACQLSVNVQQYGSHFDFRRSWRWNRYLDLFWKRLKPMQ